MGRSCLRLAWYAEAVKVASVVMAWSAFACAVGCGSARSAQQGPQSGGPGAPEVTIAPDDFVLRDVRKDAARHLDCQVPDISVELAEWAGSAGSVTAFGCGYRLNYYLRCVTNHQCSVSATD